MGISQAYTPAQYRREKAMGLRLANGLPPLRRLTARHVRILVLHLQGYKGLDIAQACRVRNFTVSRVVNDPLGRAWLQRHFDDYEAEARTLFLPAIQAVRDGLAPEQMMKDRLRAADMVFKRRGDYEDKREARTTAEDVIQRLLQVNVQVNTTDGRALIGAAAGQVFTMQTSGAQEGMAQQNDTAPAANAAEPSRKEQESEDD